LGTLGDLPATRVEFTAELLALDALCFQVRIDGRLGLLDIRDGADLPPFHDDYSYVLRFTYTPALSPFRHLLPFPTVSFHDWGQYRRLAENVEYAARGETILANFNPRVSEDNLDLTRRRLYVQGLLRHVYGNRADFELTEQTAYWRKAGECLVMVHVPGFSNNRLDRSQHQMFGLGCCTISPVIHTYLSTRPPTPWEHYVPCQDDYGDLVAKIEWCRNSRTECVNIGRGAKQFFQEQSTPETLWRQILSRVGQLHQVRKGL
jgi:hypothetical protein